MHEKTRSAKGRKMKSLRSSTVEPVLGSLINYTGMNRINSKGIGQANKCMLMAGTAYNLKKLLKCIFKPQPLRLQNHQIISSAMPMAA
jgi:hypothetical protein